ncbi:transcription initiation factor IID, 31kD subunit-domain-containing protein [Xylariomycetidae sp. FL0641]|nr:transcription initiation factor IID, 31kD subunit-domain-containing protein [Xylariomycetidae sp. FL0641]
MATTSASQTNGVPPSSQPAGPSQPNSQPTQGSASTIPNTQNSATSAAGGGGAGAAAANTTAPAPASSTSPHAPRPRDARTLELLLTSQGVTSFDSRVPLVLLDFAYRHTSAVLNDALHLSGDPYVAQAGTRPSAAAGAAPVAPGTGGDGVVSTAGVNLAIASRQAYQFRGGGLTGAGGVSKEWLAELARERNRVALPRVLANEWGVRLPNERFVLSGQGWSLREQLADAGGASDSSDDDDEGDEMMVDVAEPGADGQKKDGASDNPEDGGGGLDEFLGDDLGDEDMEGME